MKLSKTHLSILAHFTATGNRPRWLIGLLAEMEIKSPRVDAFNRAIGELIEAGMVERLMGGTVTELRLSADGASTALALAKSGGDVRRGVRVKPEEAA